VLVCLHGGVRCSRTVDRMTSPLRDDAAAAAFAVPLHDRRPSVLAGLRVTAWSGTGGGGGVLHVQHDCPHAPALVIASAAPLSTFGDGGAWCDTCGTVLRAMRCTPRVTEPDPRLLLVGTGDPAAWSSARMSGRMIWRTIAEMCASAGVCLNGLPPYRLLWALPADSDTGRQLVAAAGRCSEMLDVVHVERDRELLEVMLSVWDPDPAGALHPLALALTTARALQWAGAAGNTPRPGHQSVSGT
jgi:hypothetical protein